MPHDNKTTHNDHQHHAHHGYEHRDDMPQPAAAAGAVAAHVHQHHHAAPLAPATAPKKTVAADVEYTCPMHPQVRQMGPGSCPICGMALEPVVATADAGETPERRDGPRRFWIGLVLSIPVVALEMGGHLTGLSHLLGAQASNWLQLLLGTPGRSEE